MAPISTRTKWLHDNTRRWLSSNPSRSRWPRRLYLENLEDRTVPATIGFSQPAQSIVENIGAYNLNNFVVNRTGDVSAAQSINWAVTDGDGNPATLDAVLGVDYSRTGRSGSIGSALSGTLSWGAGVGGTQTLSGLLNVVETRVAHTGSRYLSIVLTSTSGTDTIINAGNTLEIKDSAPGLPVIASIVPNVSGNNVTITVARQGGSFGPLTVTWQTLNGTAVAGTDYTGYTDATYPGGNPLVWGDGDTSIKLINIPVLDYATLSGSKTFSLDLGKTGIPSPSAYWSFDTADNLNTNPAIGVITDLSGNGNNLVNNTRQLGTGTRGSYGNENGLGAPFVHSMSDGTTVSDLVTGPPGLPGNALAMNSGSTYLYDQADIASATWNSGGESAAIGTIHDNGDGTVTVTTLAPNTFVNGEKIRISRVTTATAYNTTTPVTITVTDNMHFTTSSYLASPGTHADQFVGTVYASSAGIAAATMTGTTVTITTSSPITGLVPGAPVIIAGLTPNGYNGTFIIATAPDNTHFTYINTTYPQDINGTQRTSSVNIFKVSEDGSGNVTFVASTPERFESGQTVVVSGFTGTASGYNGTYTLSGAGGAPNTYNFVGTYTGIALGLPTVGGDDTTGTTGSALLTLPAATAFGDASNAAAFGNVTFGTTFNHNLQLYSTARVGGGTSNGTSNPGVNNSTTWQTYTIPQAYGDQTLYTVVGIGDGMTFTAVTNQTSAPGQSATNNNSLVDPGAYIAGGELNDGGFGQGPTWDGPETFLVGSDRNGFMNPISAASTDNKIYVQSTVGFPTQAPFWIQLGSGEKAKVVGIAPGTGAFVGYTQYTLVRYASNALVFPGLGSNTAAGQTTLSAHTAMSPVILVITPATGKAENATIGTSPIDGNGAYQELLQPYNTDAPFSIASATSSGTTASITVNGNTSTFVVGQNVTISGFLGGDGPFNGTFPLSNVVYNSVANTFTMSMTNTNIGLPASAASVANTFIQGVNDNLPTQLGGLTSSSANPYVNPRLNSLGTMGQLADGVFGNSSSTSSGTMTYSFWLNVPVINGSPNGGSAKYLNQDVMILSHQSDMTGGASGNEGQVLLGPVPGQNASAGIYTLKFRADNRPDGSPNQMKIATNISFGLGSWNMFTLEWTPQGLILFQNGEYKQTLPSMGTYNPAAAQQVIDSINGRFRVNNVSQTSVSAQQGGNIIMDDLALWQQTLTPAQIQAIYQKGVKAAWQNTATVTIGSPTPGVTADVITAQPTSVTINPGGNASFTVFTSNGVGPDTVQWQVSKYDHTSNTYSGFADITNGGIYSNATSATLSITGTQTASILSATESVNTATIVTTGSHPFVVGDMVTVSGVHDVIGGVDNLGYNGTFVVTAVSTTNVANDTFTYTAVAGLTSATSLGGATVKNTLSGYRYQAVITNHSSNGPATLTTNAVILGVDVDPSYFQPTDTGSPGALPLIRLRSVSGLGTNQTAFLYATSASTAVDAVQWYQSVDGGFNFTAVPASQVDSSEASSTQPQLVYKNVVQADLGIYKAVFTNAAGTVTSNPLTLTTATETVTAQPSSLTVRAGATATFTATATSVATGDQVSWQRSTDGGATWTLVSGPTTVTNGTATLTLTNVSPAQNGYQYRAAFANGTVLSNAATLSVTFLVYEPFNYYVPSNAVDASITDPTGNTLLGQGPGAGNTSTLGLTGTWTNDGPGTDLVVAGSIGYPTYTTYAGNNGTNITNNDPLGSGIPASVAPIGNSAINNGIISRGTTAQNEIALSSSFGDTTVSGSGTYYVSFLMTQGLNAALTAFPAALTLISTDADHKDIEIGWTNGLKFAAGNASQIFSGSTTGITFNQSVTLNGNQTITVHLVAAVTFTPGSNTTVSLYMDPGFGTTPAAGSLISTADLGADYHNIGAIGLKDSGRAWFDELRIASNYGGLWADPTAQGVTPTLAAPSSDPRFNGIRVPAVADAVRNGANNGTVADGTVNVNVVALGGGASNITNAGLFRFSDGSANGLSNTVPAGFSISSAKVILTALYPQPFAGSTVIPTAAYNVTSSWNDSAANPNPSVDTSVTVATGTGTAAVGQYAYDITSLAQQWLSGAVANNGIAIAQTGSNTLDFFSREWTNSTTAGYVVGNGDRPILVLTLTRTSGIGISSNGGAAQTSSANVNVPAGTTAVTTVTVANPTGQTLGYSLSGADAGQFSITGGNLAFVSAPTTAALYSVTVNVTGTGGSGNTTASQTLAVKVTPEGVPTLDAISTQTVPVNAPQQTVNLTGISDPNTPAPYAVSVNFSSGTPGDTLTSGQAAGVIPVSGWNNKSSGGSSTLTDSNSATLGGGVTVSYTSSTASNVGGSVFNLAPSSGSAANNALMSSGISNGNSTITFGNLSASFPNGFDVYVYLAPEYAFATAKGTISDGTRSVNYLVVPAPFNGFVQSTGYNVAGSYVVLPNESGNTLTLTNTPSPNAWDTSGFTYSMVTGIQLVPRGAPQPLQITTTSSNTAVIPQAAVSYTPNNATGTLTYTPTGGMAGSSLITVNVTDGNYTTTRQFTINVSAGTPTVTGIAPNNGPTSGGTSVTITGTNFVGVSAVTFGTTAATSFVVNSATSITAIAPAGSVGTVDVTVTTPGGTTANNPPADSFTYVAAPAVTGLVPNTGPIAGGTSVGITGSSFVGVTAVLFGTTAATSYTVDSPTHITAVAPAGTTPGVVDVSVANSLGTSANTAADDYTYTTTTTTSLAALSSVVYGTQVTFTATVSASPYAAPSVGTVTFTDNGVPLPGTSTVPVVGGVAQYTTFVALTAGTHPIVATYNGGTGYLASPPSATQNQVVTPKALTVSGLANNKVYDGTTAATLNTTPTIISVNFQDDVGQTLAATDSAGVVAAQNWNNMAVVNQASGVGGIVNAAGGSTTVTADWTGDLQSGGDLTPASSSAANNKLMTGGIRSIDTTYSSPFNSQYQFAHLNANLGGSYSVYVYLDPNYSFMGATGTIYLSSGGYTQGYTPGYNAPTATDIPGAPVAQSGFRVERTAFTGFAQTTSTTSAGNYVVFNNVSLDNLVVTVVTSGPVGSGGFDAVTVTGIQLVNSGPQLVGLVGTDSVALAYSSPVGTFTSRNVGSSVPVNVTGLSLTGPAAANYSLASPVTSAAITVRPITVTAQTNTKPYDGNTSAAATPLITTGTLGSGDSAGFTETYDTPNAGTGKTLTPAGTVSDGNGGANYAVTFVNDTTGVITAPATSTALTSNPNPSSFNQVVTLTATVSGGVGNNGTVDFRDNGVAIPGGAGIPVVNGVATFQVSTLGIGSHPLTAAYNGGGAFGNSTSTPALNQVVGAQAGLLVYEPFNYFVPTHTTDASIVNPPAISILGEGPASAGASTSLGLTGAYYNRGSGTEQIVDGSGSSTLLSYPETGAPGAVAPIGNMAINTFAAQAGDLINLAPAARFGDSGGATTVWLSLLLKPQTSGNYWGWSLEGAGADGIVGNSDDAGFLLGWGAAGSQLGVFPTSTGGGTATVTTLNAQAPVVGTTYHLVARIDFTGTSGTDTVTAYVNPGFGTAPTSGSELNRMTGLNLGDITRMGFFILQRGWADEVRIADSYASLWTDPTTQGVTATTSGAATDNRYTGIRVPAVADASLNGGNNDATGFSSVLKIVALGSTGNDTGLFKFDNLSTYVPTGDVITSAKVVLTSIYPTLTNGSALINTTAYQVTSTWDDATPNQNPTISTTALATGTGTQANGRYEFDITTLAQQWLAGSTPNNGIAVKEATGAGLSFFSREGGFLSGTNYNPQYGDRPVLVLQVAPAPQANVTVAKVADAATVTAGAAAGYTLTITNSGTATATGLTLADALPALGGANLWTINGGANQASFQITGPSGSQQLALNGVSTLAAGGTLVVHITGITTPSGPPYTATLSNTATVDASNENNHNQTSGAVNIAVQSPNVTVTKVADAGTVSAGGAAGYAVTITNNGTGQANGLTVTDALPALGGSNLWTINGGANQASFTITGAAGSQQLALNGVSTLAAGSSLVVHITGTTTPSGSPYTATLSNTATVNASNEATHNQSSGASTITVQSPNVTVTKTADASSVNQGSAAGYTVTITNNGAGLANGLTLTDALPALGGSNLWTINGGANQASFTITGAAGSQQLALNGVSTLAAGGTLVVHITGTPSVAGTLSNTATVDASNETTHNQTGSASITVTSPNLSVVQFTPSESGFHFTLSGAPVFGNLNVQPNTPGFTGGADVLVTGPVNSLHPTGVYTGTLVQDAADPTSFTWIATGDPGTTQTKAPATQLPLAAGTYTIKLVSGASAWTSATLGVLQGGVGDTNPGTSDYDNSFTVTTNPYVSVPNVVLGPGQPLSTDASYTSTANLGADGSGSAVKVVDVPLFVSAVPANADGISFDLVYNPNLLTLFSGGANGGTGLTITSAGASLGIFSGLATVNPYFDTTNPNAYVARFGFSLVNPTATSTPVAFATFAARVPDGTYAVPGFGTNPNANGSYGQKAVLNLGNLTVTAGASTLPYRADSGVDVNAYVGDVTGDRQLLPADATAALQLFGAGPQNHGLQAYPLIDPTLIADATFDGNVLPADATAIIREFGNPSSTTIPNQLATAQTATSGPDPVLTIPTNLTATAGGVVNVPVNIDFIDRVTVGGVDGITLVLGFDNRVFDARGLTAQAVQLGSVLGKGWVVGDVAVYNADGKLSATPSGTIVISLYTAAPQDFAPGVVGSVVTVPLALRPDAPVGGTQINLRADNAPYGAQATRITQYGDGRGIVISPAPTNADDDRAVSAFNGQFYVVDGTVTVQAPVNDPGTGSAPPVKGVGTGKEWVALAQVFAKSADLAAMAGGTAGKGTGLADDTWARLLLEAPALDGLSPAAQEALALNLSGNANRQA
jgi:hypothetical protein